MEGASHLTGKGHLVASDDAEAAVPYIGHLQQTARLQHSQTDSAAAQNDLTFPLSLPCDACSAALSFRSFVWGDQGLDLEEASSLGTTKVYLGTAMTR